MSLSSFVFQTTRNVLFELGSARRVGELMASAVGTAGGLCNSTSSRTVLLVTDKGVHNSGLTSSCIRGLQDKGYGVEVFSAVVADPPASCILEAVDVAKARGVCGVVGLGGGSSMDVAKVVAYLSHPTCQQSLQDIYGVGMCLQGRIPLIQVPTTAGTGSEVTPISIVTTGESEKKGIVSPQLLPDWAVLDGELTLSLPPAVTAATGIDAMVHAIEAYTSKIKKNPLSDLLACESLRLLGGNIRTVSADGGNAPARGSMLLGSMYAGMAFANSPVGAVHALAYPIGSIFHVPHGVSNAMMLPHVLRFNSACKSGLAAKYYSQLLPLVFPVHNQRNFQDASAAGNVFASAFEELGHDLNVPMRLRDVGIQPSDLDMLTTEAMKQTRLLPNNARAVAREDVLSMYQAAY